MLDSDLYDTLQHALAIAGVQRDAAYAHGLLCGRLSAAESADRARWMADVFEDAKPRGDAARDCLAALATVHEETTEAMGDLEFGFRLLIPGDHEPIADRAAALGGWCEGYLAGIGLAAPGAEALPDAAREVLADFAEIARIELDPDAGEENEQAYTELVEYVRVGALTVREHALIGAGGEGGGDGDDGTSSAETRH